MHADRLGGLLAACADPADESSVYCADGAARGFRGVGKLIGDGFAMDSGSPRRPVRRLR